MGIDQDARERLERSLGHRFARPELLERALTHRSWTYEAQGESGGGTYERLEFLGDALLGFLVAEHLWRRDPTASEGLLTRRRQIVVRSRALAEAATRLGLGEALRLGRGEEGTGGRAKRSLLADVFEAVLGAVYLDGGIAVARDFVERHLGEALDEAAGSDEVGGDHKTRLQEAVQARLRTTPTYRLVETRGPDHARMFRAEVLVGGQVVGSGEGTSRQRAEQVAALHALERWDEG